MAPWIKYGFFNVLLLIWSCQHPNPNLQGVWYTTDPSLADHHYYEAHITDTTFTVVDDVQLTYVATYERKEDTLVQYLRNIKNDFRVTDTIKFILILTPDSMTMVNAINPNSSSNWTKVSNLTPLNFLDTNSLDQFPIDFRNRYQRNYLEKHEPQNINLHLRDFDAYWKEYE